MSLYFDDIGLKRDFFSPFLSHKERCRWAALSKTNYKQYKKWICHEKFRRIPKDILVKIERELSQLDKVDQRINGIARAFASEPWNAEKSVFTFPKFPFYAWKAFEADLITETQLNTMLSFHAAHATFKRENTALPRAVQLFDSELQPYPKAVELLMETVVSAYPEKPFISPAQFDAFMEMMKMKPRSERQFIIYQKRPGYDGSISGRLSKIGVRILVDPNTENGIAIVPSFGMQQAMLDVMFGPRAVHLNGVFGESSGKDLKQCVLNGMRDVLIPFPFVKQPKLADGFPASRMDYLRHEFYHAVILSFIPPKHRELYIRFSGFIANLELSELRGKLHDMELAQYRSDYRDDIRDEVLFWVSIGHLIYMTTKDSFEMRLRAIDKLVEFYSIIAKQPEYGITLEGLKDAKELVQKQLKAAPNSAFLLGVEPVLVKLQSFCKAPN